MGKQVNLHRIHVVSHVTHHKQYVRVGKPRRARRGSREQQGRRVSSKISLCPLSLVCYRKERMVCRRISKDGQ